MPSGSEVKCEIGHVLFIDIVGYSKLLITEQSAQIQKLKEIVRETEQVRIAETEGKLLRLPTGDGGALVFRTSPEAPVLCATEISKELKKYPELRVRMGIHSGPVNEITDLNEQANIAGAGINIAQRVMDCGDAGHILLSKHVAGDLEHYPRWKPYLHELGECEVKHGTRLGVVNLYQDGIGNPQLPKKFQALKKRRVRMRWAALTTLLFLVSVIVAAFVIVSRRPMGSIITAPENLPEIARQLGVANILEGSVQKSGDSVRVNVQLIKAANDSHLWADTFDRKLTDVFAVESEIAKSIADTLKAKLTDSEEHAISARPTENTKAHQFYLKGRYFWNKRTGPDLQTAIDYFKQAIEQDSNYALAYAGLADSHVLLPYYGAGTLQQSIPPANAAAQKALELDATLAEPHSTLGLILYSTFDFAESKREFERAIALNPNDATAHQWFGNGPLIVTGEFERAIAEGKRAVELDPLSLVVNTDLAVGYTMARRYPEAIEQFNNILAMDPQFYYARWAFGLALQFDGQLPEAIAQYKKAAELTDDPFVLAWLAQGYAQAGQRDEALKLLAQMDELATKRYVGAWSFAIVHLALGEKEKAIDELERAFRERGDPFITFIKVSPLFDPLRGDPRFQALLAKAFSPGKK